MPSWGCGAGPREGCRALHHLQKKKMEREKRDERKDREERRVLHKLGGPTIL